MSHPADRTVLVLLHERVLGGATLSLLGTIPLLRERGWRFLFWVATPSPLRDELERRGLEAHGAPRPVGYSIRTLRLPPGPGRRTMQVPAYFGGLATLVRERRPALVHANSLFTLAEAAAARAAGGRVLLHLHELVPDGWKGRLARMSSRLVARERIAVSAASARTLGTDGVRVVYGGVQLPEHPADVRPYPSPFVVGTVGPISRNKGSDVFVDAAGKVLAERDGVAFRMIGALRDPLEPEWGRRVVERARSLGIEHREQGDLAAELPRWDAFVLPSRIDAFPGAVLNAMALGLPVIGARTGGIPEQVGADAGLVVEPRADAIAAAILELSGAPAARRAAMGAAGRRRVAERFTVDRQAEGLEAAYRAVAG
jgi:glycosyltransferase involved in cell wall biosynthesis